MFRKKIPVGRIIPPFFFESSQSDRVFYYLHDLNSIFWARGTVSFGKLQAVFFRFLVFTQNSKLETKN